MITSRESRVGNDLWGAGVKDFAKNGHPLEAFFLFSPFSFEIWFLSSCFALLKRSVALLKESVLLGCVSEDSHPRKSVPREPGKVGSKHAVKNSPQATGT